MDINKTNWKSFLFLCTKESLKITYSFFDASQFNSDLNLDPVAFVLSKVKNFDNFIYSLYFKLLIFLYQDHYCSFPPFFWVLYTIEIL